MHSVDVFTHFFFVPNRLVWDNWGKFISGEKINGNDPVHPYINKNEVNNSVFTYDGSLFDFLGIQKRRLQCKRITCKRLSIDL